MGRTKMRFPVIAIVIGCVGVAHADRGYFFEESVGGAAYAGDLAAYGSGALRVQGGGGYRRDDLAITAVAGAVVNDPFYLECESEECNASAGVGGYVFFGFDVKRTYRLLDSRWSRFNVRTSLHAGPRYFVGTDALRGYEGPGVNAGASIEANAWVIGYFLDIGVDAMWMRIPVDTMMGSAPYVMFGGKLGWL